MNPILYYENDPVFGKNRYLVMTPVTHQLLGELYQEVDGYFVFWPNVQATGAWSEASLLCLVNKLAELNRVVDERMNQELGKS